MPLSDNLSDLITTKLHWATEREVEPASRHGPMYPDGIPAWLLLRGQLRLRFDDASEQVGPGYWIFPKSGAAWHDFTDDAVIISIRFELRGLGGSEIYPRRSTVVMGANELPELTRTARNLIRSNATKPNTSRIYQYLTTQAHFAAWLKEYSRLAEDFWSSTTAVPVDNRIVKARDLLNEHPLDRPLDRAHFATQVGLSVPQLTRLFIDAYGSTPRRYFEKRRFHWVCRELVKGEKTNKEIASSIGFRSLSQFSNWFTRLAEVSPRKYKNNQLF